MARQKSLKRTLLEAPKRRRHPHGRIPRTSVCVRCDEVTPGVEYCFGCKQYICVRCDIAPAGAIKGRHHLVQHFLKTYTKVTVLHPRWKKAA